MRWWRQAGWAAAAVMAGAWMCLAGAQITAAGPEAAKFPVPAGLIPPSAQLHSPVDFFRRLLAMTPKERMDYLTNRTPEIRERIMAKVREYQELDPNERELRLRATDLSWYLLPLLREAPDKRAAQLASVPEDLRELIRSRLAVWDTLTPESQKEFLDNEQTLRYLTHVEAANLLPGVNPSHWNALPDGERQKITEEFNQFFSLTDAEKEKALNTLSDAERAQMERTLEAFEKLPPLQRGKCIHAFGEFASMSPADRAEFLRNAERWSEMSPKDRQAWRDLVAQVPLWPPARLPMPPPPARVSPRPQAAMATNLN